MKPPVLFLVFNRPEPTSKVFGAIRQARPERLYVAADGPRASRPADVPACEAARRIALAVDWPCEVRRLLRDENLGLRRAVGGAIGWFFEHEACGIVLEDDCLPSASFFPYCADLLERYRDDPRVMSIGGSNFQRGQRRGCASYFATKHFHCWGWASWRRAWNEYDGELATVGSTLEAGLRALRDGSSAFGPYWRYIYRDCRAGRYSSWAYPMHLTCFARVGAGRETLHLAPQANLVANLGFDGEGTHVVPGTNQAEVCEDIELPLVHPERLVRDVDADRFTDAYHYKVGWLPLVKDRLIQNLPGVHRAYRRILARGRT